MWMLMGFCRNGAFEDKVSCGTGDLSCGSQWSLYISPSQHASLDACAA